MIQTPHDEKIVDQFLFESGVEDASELKPLLLELRSFVGSEPVAPSAELAELLGAPSPHSASPSAASPSAASPSQARTRQGLPTGLEARRRIKRRASLTAVAVAASMGIGTAAVAATDPVFRQQAAETIATVIDTVTHGNSGREGQGKSPGSTKTPAHNGDHPNQGDQGNRMEQETAKDDHGKGTSGTSEGVSSEKSLSPASLSPASLSPASPSPATPNPASQNPASPAPASQGQANQGQTGKVQGTDRRSPDN
ncbi:hypothetical protein [Arthrobacter sp. M4]|uniref:hypothetical protein n=1 Tax=Arthrobacter sp. M4 TaxID=218160 RepID=UPI001CDD7565|nr:hypothetical protein [Arthrobacter sp. M4]MCA4135113.1 hypothetical protein [Arthrobacter sp. M4]